MAAINGCVHACDAISKRRVIAAMTRTRAAFAAELDGGSNLAKRCAGAHEGEAREHIEAERRRRRSRMVSSVENLELERRVAG